MEAAERLDSHGVKGLGKPRTLASRKPKSGGSHTSFLNEHDNLSPWASHPLDSRNVVISDKGLNSATGKYLKSHSQGDGYTRGLGNSNIMGRLEMGKDDLGWSSRSGYRMANGDDDSVAERNEIKRARMEFADLNGKHLGKSPDGDRNYDRGGSKTQAYEHSRSCEKSSRDTDMKALCKSAVLHDDTHATDGRRPRKRLILQENSDDEDDFDVRVVKQELPKKKPHVDTGASIPKMDIHGAKEGQKGQLVDEVTTGNQPKLTNNVVAKQPVRKSSRVPKKRILDAEHYVYDVTKMYTGYWMKVLRNKISRTTKKCVQNGEYDEGEEHKTLRHQSSRIPKKHMRDTEYEEDNEVQQHKRRWKRSKYQTDSEHLYHEDAEEPAALGGKDVEKTDVDLEGMKKRSKGKQGVGNSTVDDNKEVPLTARQRTILACKDAGSEVGVNLIEFPEGWPQTSRRKRKEKLSEVEQQLKKTEAAQRHKMQLKNAENATQDEAIKKILGKDSSRKKRGDKLQKQRDAMAQKKAASAMSLASNGVRWVMGPSGTVVTFSENTGLPSIFNNPCRYPPPREKCAGPLCNNLYKYRDSKTNLPLCSLQCYQAIHAVQVPV